MRLGSQLLGRGAYSKEMSERDHCGKKDDKLPKPQIKTTNVAFSSSLIPRGNHRNILSAITCHYGIITSDLCIIIIMYKVPGVYSPTQGSQTQPNVSVTAFP